MAGQVLVPSGGGELLFTAEPPSNGPSRGLEESVRRHFELLHVPGYSLALAAIDPATKTIEHRFAQNAAQAVAFARQWNRRRNVYVGVNLFPENHHGGRTRDEVAALQGVHVDLDPDPGDASAPAGVCLSILGGVLEAVPRVLGTPRMRAIQLYSGRGAQAVVLGTPRPLGNSAEREAAHEGGKVFLALLSRDEYVRDLLHLAGFKLDPTGDLPRLMRLAGTTNLKTGHSAYLDPDGPAPKRRDGLAEQLVVMGREKAHTPRVAEVGRGRIPPPLPDWARDLIQRSPLLLAMWKADVPPGRRSEHEFALCRCFHAAAIRSGYTVGRDELAALLWEKPHGKAENPSLGDCP